MIRPICEHDKDTFISFADKFYHSQAVDHTIPVEHHAKTFNTLMQSNTYALAYMFEYNNITVGYSLLSKTYSNEAGGMVLWIEEIFILEEYRNKGLTKDFFKFLKEISKDYARIRLEVTPSNVKAKRLYSNMGFETLEYLQMVKDL